MLREENIQVLFQFLETKYNSGCQIFDFEYTDRKSEGLLWYVKLFNPRVFFLDDKKFSFLFCYVKMSFLIFFVTMCIIQGPNLFNPFALVILHYVQSFTLFKYLNTSFLLWKMLYLH